MGDNEIKENNGIEEVKGKKYLRSEAVVEELIRVLEILKKYNFDMSKLPRGAGKTLGMMEDLSEIIKKENLNPEYDIGLVIKKVTYTMRDSKRGKSKWTPLNISEEKIKKLEELGLTANKPKKKIYVPKKEDRRKFSKQPFATEELIGILKILQEEEVNIGELPRSNKKLGEIASIAEIVKKSGLNPEYNIGCKISNVALSMRLADEHSLRRLPFSVTSEQRRILENMGITARKERKKEKKEKIYKKTNYVDRIIDVLRKLKKYEINISELPRSSKKLSELKGVAEIIEKENLNPEYDIGLAMMYITRTMRFIEENGKVGNKAYRISDEQIDILKKLGVIGRKPKKSEKKTVKKHKKPKEKRKVFKRKSAVTELIRVLEIIKKYEFNMDELPRKSKKIGEIEELAEIIEKEKLNPEYNLGTAIRNATVTMRAMEEGDDKRIIFKMSQEQLSVLKDLGLTERKIKKTREKKKIRKPLRKSAADKLMEILDILEENIPGISTRLPKGNVRLGDIEEIQKVIEREGISKEVKIRISEIVNKAKRTVLNLYVDRVISESTIDKLKKYGLLTDEKIEEYRKIEVMKSEGKTKVQTLIEVLQLLRNHGVNILNLPRNSKRIGDIDEAKDIAKEVGIDENYDIGTNLGRTIQSIKEVLSSQKSHFTITDDEIKTLRGWGFVTDWDLEKYQKKITAVQELIIISRKLKDRGINLRSLLHYECEIGQIDDIEDLEQIIQEEGIEPKYKIGKVMRYVENLAKSKILEQENPQYRESKKITIQSITDEEIEQLKELRIITEEAMQKYRETQMRKIQGNSPKNQLKQNRDEEIKRIMQVSVSKCVGENIETRSSLEELSKVNETPQIK